MRHGSQIDPPNRFQSVRTEDDWEQLQWEDDYRQGLRSRRIQYFEDATESIVTSNHSPDIPFNHSVNPYRGCAHGCAYCYARNTHEYLGFNAGLDFETRIMVKTRAAELLRQFLSRKAWQGEPISFSGVTDCYQPAERDFRLTRACLEVALEFCQPISIITKNALVTRDLDLLRPLAVQRLVHVFLSITSLQPQLARDMEPRTSTPDARLRAVRMLADAGVPVGVMVAPIIPGLNDVEIPAVLQAAQQAGAQTAGSVLLRLPLTVEPVFREWLYRTQPLKAEMVEGRIRQTRTGRLNQSQFGQRMRGRGPLADQIRALFRVMARKHGLDQPLPPHDASRFRRPDPDGGHQLTLF